MKKLYILKKKKIIIYVFYTIFFMLACRHEFVFKDEGTFKNLNSGLPITTVTKSQPIKCCSWNVVVYSL